MKLSILIPVYNEEKTLDLIFSKVLELEKSPLVDTLEVIAVDDCSKDNSSNLLRKLESDKKIRLFTQEQNKGKGAAIKTAISMATGDYVVFQDADLEYDPQDLLKMLDFAVQNGFQPDFSETRFHHEIYLSDPRKVSADKLKTIIRHPIK